MPAPDCRLGIDVGGTNTDAVIMDTADRLIATAKVPTTPDITGGHRRGHRQRYWPRPAVEPSRISHVMLGTTHATNAVLERRNLRPGRRAPARRACHAQHQAHVRLAGANSPPDVSVGTAIVDGGIEFDGQDLSPLDTDAIARFLGQVGARPTAWQSPACSPRSPPRHELEAAEVVKRELGDIHVSLSHEIGSLGLLERENATILNGALAGVASDVARAMRSALTAHGLRPVTYFAQNDGTLMSLDQALRYPVLTIGSGPANSVRGAAFLTGSVRFARRRRGRHLHGHRRAGQRVPAGILLRGGDRRRPDQLPDAGPGSRSRSAAARWFRRRATGSPARPAQRRVPAARGSAGLRRDDGHAHRRRRRGRPGGGWGTRPGSGRTAHG